jgi:hypothetical protein
MILGSESRGTHGYILLSGGSGSFQIGWLVKLLVVLVGRVIFGFRSRRDFDQDFFSFLDINVFEKWGLFFEYIRAVSVQVTMGTVHPFSLQYSK